ncbi:MAG: Ig domain-containing protein [Gaiellaceae bacterium]
MRFARLAFLMSLLALVLAPIAAALAFTDASYNTPVGVTGQPYSHKFEIRLGGGCDPYRYTILSGQFPPGLTFVTEGKGSGTVGGTPTTAGSYSFWLEGKDTPAACGDPLRTPATTQREFTIKILQGLNILQNALNPKATFLNEPYSFQLSADGGGSQVWSVKSGSLPAGMGLASNGVISGTPTATGDFTFVVQVSDGSRSDSETYTLTVVQRLKITAVSPAGEVGVPFAVGLKSTGGRPANTWSVIQGTLPNGLTLNPATGEITGTPAGPGTYPLKVQVTDSLGLTDTVDVPLKVAARLAVVKKPLRALKVGSPYTAKLAARGGVSPLKWNVLGGKPGFLPAGIKFNSRTGVFSGTPTKAGIYRLRIQAVDKLRVKSAIGIILKVNA